MPRFRYLLLLLLASSVPAAAPAADTPIAPPFDPWIAEHLIRHGEAEVLVVLSEQADLGAAAELSGQAAKGRWVVETLRRTAARTQAPILRRLAERGVPHRTYWVANLIWVRAGTEVLEELAARPEVARLAANPVVALRLPSGRFEPAAATPEAVEASIVHVGAPTLWALGIDGSGVVVGGQDTGYDWDHEALVAAYRGTGKVGPSHDYNWHDAIHVGGGVCGPDSPEPCDDFGHGTHTMGTMVGDDGASRQIGVAPGAAWIGCRNMDQGNGTPASYSECFEFFLAPTDGNGENPDPDRAPQIINNSWSCPASEGCTDPEILRTVVENVRSAGILVVASAGNSGSGCSSVNTPPAIYEASFAVAATDNSDLVAGFSSRGPVTVDGSQRLKPDLAAPGVSITSSQPGDTYGASSGTSMAGPHVAGVAALLLQAAPCLDGDVAGLEAALRQTALPRTSAQTCGGFPGSEVPNPVYGWGALRASPGFFDFCPLFRDGFESGGTGGWSQATP